MRTIVTLGSSLLLVACAADHASEQIDQAAGASTAADIACPLSAADVLAAAPTEARRSILQRGFAWVNAEVPYSQSAEYDGYRTDASGFVSMCWSLSSSHVARELQAGEGEDLALSSYDELLPGDALVSVTGRMHTVLFAGWTDASRTSACTLELPNADKGMQFRKRTAPSLTGDGFEAIRAQSLAAETAQ